MSHQVGSFMGALGGGLLFDAMGSCNRAVKVGECVGLLAVMVQMAFALKAVLPPRQTRLA